MDTATVAVIATSSVAGLSIAANLLQHARTLKHERQLTDLGHVRDVLDDAAVLLHRIAYILDSVRMALIQTPMTFFEDEKRAQTYRVLRRSGEECDALRERLTIRLGEDHDAVSAFTKLDSAVLEIFRCLDLIRFETETPPDPGSATSQVRGIVERKRDEIDQYRAAFDGHRAEFMRAAHGAAGARLPGERRHWPLWRSTN